MIRVILFVDSVDSVDSRSVNALLWLGSPLDSPLRGCSVS